MIYFGESLGAAVVTELAAEHPPAALVLRSPFVDLAAVAQELAPLLPVRLLLRDHFPVLAVIAKIRVPTLVVYGTADTVVPPWQSRAVADGAGGPVEVVAVPGADHNDRVLLDGSALIGSVRAVARTRGLPTAELTGCGEVSLSEKIFLTSLRPGGRRRTFVGTRGRRWSHVEDVSDT